MEILELCHMKTERKITGLVAHMKSSSEKQAKEERKILQENFLSDVTTHSGLDLPPSRKFPKLYP